MTDSTKPAQWGEASNGIHVIHAEGSAAEVELFKTAASSEWVDIDEFTSYMPSWNDPDMIALRRKTFDERTQEYLRMSSWPWWRKLLFRFERWRYCRTIGTPRQWCSE